MPTRNVVLTDQQEIFLGGLVADGRYQNASEVLREGLRLLENQILRRKEELANIRDGIITGINQIDNGELARGSGNDAIERAFISAKLKRGL
mgnify:FL=1